MRKICGMCLYNKGICKSDEICVNGSGFIDKRESFSLQVAIDKEDNNLHIIVDGDIIHDYEEYGKYIFDVIQKATIEYVKG